MTSQTEDICFLKKLSNISIQVVIRTFLSILKHANSKIFPCLSPNTPSQLYSVLKSYRHHSATSLLSALPKKVFGFV